MIVTIKKGNLDEHDPHWRHNLPFNMTLWSFAYSYSVLTMNVDQTIDGVKTFENFPLLPGQFPSVGNQAAHKNYVDDTVSFETLNAKGDVGADSDQLAQGDHSHDTLPTQDQKDALDTSNSPSASNPFVTWDTHADHSTRHEANGADQVSLNGLSGDVNLTGMKLAITTVAVTPYTVLDSSLHLSIDTSLLAITLNLPVITSSNHGRYYTVKDGYSNAGKKNITISPNGTDQIDNEGSGVSYVLSSDNVAVGLVANNTTKNWELVPVETARLKVIEIAGATALTGISANEVVVLCDTDLSGFTVDLPSIASVESNIIFNILNKGSSGNDVTVDGDGIETIDGETTQEVPDASSIRIIPTSGGWYIL